MTFHIGDHVKPKPPHEHDHAGRKLPQGEVINVEPFGRGQRLLVDDGLVVLFLAGYFERTSDGPH